MKLAIITLIFSLFSFSAILSAEPSDKMKEVILEHRNSTEYLQYEYPLLTYAIAHNYDDIAFRLIAGRTELNGYAKDRLTSALYQAVLKKNKDLIEALLMGGADPNAEVIPSVLPGGYEIQNSYDRPLILAVRCTEGIEIIQLLLDYGANPNLDKQYGAIWSSVYAGDVEKFELLLSYGAEISNFQGQNSDCFTNLLYTASYEMNKTFRPSKKIILQRLIELGLDINFHGKYAPSPLQAAVSCCWREAVELLLSEGADINNVQVGTWKEHRTNSSTKPSIKHTHYIDCSEKTTLLYSALEGNLSSQTEIYDMVELLIKAGADVNEKTYCELNKKLSRGGKPYGRAIIKAIDKENYAAASLLIEKGAVLDFAINEKSVVANTPLLLAIWEHDEEGALFLIEHGADPEFTGNSVHNPLDLAIRYDMKRLVTAIVDAISAKYK